MKLLLVLGLLALVESWKRPDVCKMSAASRLYVPRRLWYYNQMTQECQLSSDVLCEGNGRFTSLKECQRQCLSQLEICSLPSKTGMCRIAMDRWYYNPATMKCEIFTYGGCDANANNFETEEDCLAECQGQSRETGN